MKNQNLRPIGGRRFFRPPHETVLAELTRRNPRYHEWIDLYGALDSVRAILPTAGSHGWPPHSMVGTAFDRMIQLAERDRIQWIALRMAVHKELRDRNLVDDEGRICP
jgi:hypothetical protein